jgi:hypothetical protein
MPIAYASAQERGSLQLFGESGRLISSVAQSDVFLLSKQSYSSEDSFGFQGQIRIVKKYEGGGYEELIRDYVAHCSAVDQPGGGREVFFSTPGDDDDTYSVPIKQPDRRPAEVSKGAYNLYWATCQGQFRKFN